MNDLAQIAALVGAVAYLGASPVEMFLIDRPWARRFLHVEYESLTDVRMWAFCIGARNLIAGAGAIIGLAILQWGTEETGRTVVLTVSWYMLLASLAMAVADALGLWRPRGGSVLGTVASSLPPLVVILASL
ncbi:MAG TPA: DUF1304 family protein [Nocardioidaceae bacterium]|nr:DUF1304 family protein [Nocardioidaceae bacterium]